MVLTQIFFGRGGGKEGIFRRDVLLDGPGFQMLFSARKKQTFDIFKILVSHILMDTLFLGSSAGFKMSEWCIRAVRALKYFSGQAHYPGAHMDPPPQTPRYVC